MMRYTNELILFMAAFFGGLINGIAGGGTIVSFPALVWVGLDPKIANATSTVALWPGAISSAWGYRHEMSDSRRWLIRLGGPSVLGGIAGAQLLRYTPADTFKWLVPYLLLFATFLFIAQEPIGKRLKKHNDSDEPTLIWWTGAISYHFFVGVYGGYFGAGIGILMLASLGLLGISNIHRANGIKNSLGAFVNGIAVVNFVIFKMVYWPYALLMVGASILGGYSGSHLARRLGRKFVRATVIIIGLAISVLMLLS